MMAEWLERFHPRTALQMKLVRLFLLYLSSLYGIIIALFTLSTQCVSHNYTDCGSVTEHRVVIIYPSPLHYCRRVLLVEMQWRTALWTVVGRISSAKNYSN